MLVGHCIEHIWRRVSQNGDSMILLHGALVNFFLDGLRSRKHRCSWIVEFSEKSPTLRKPLCLTLALQKYFKQHTTKSPICFWKMFFWKCQIRKTVGRKRRADKSLKFVLSYLEHLAFQFNLRNLNIWNLFACSTEGIHPTAPHSDFWLPYFDNSFGNVGED